MTPNEISHYESLQKQDTENRKLIKKLQLDKQAMKEQLSLYGVSQHRELLAFIEEVSEFDALVSSTRLRLRAKELLKANCG
jgi:hypothetical protein